MKGHFITFEGGEGSGKSSLIKRIAKDLNKKGYDVLVTREPGGIKIAEQIRNVILNKDNTEMDEITEAYLFAAARRQHLVEKVIPSLQEGKIVLCDRFVDSSIVYQGYARSIGMEKVRAINDIVIDGYYPDLTLFFDVTPEIGLSRIRQGHRRLKMNRLDVETANFHNKVYEGYQKLAKQEERIVVVDGEKSKDEVYNNTLNIILEKIND